MRLFSSGRWRASGSAIALEGLDDDHAGRRNRHEPDDVLVGEPGSEVWISEVAPGGNGQIDLHTKGVLLKRGLLTRSMNLTYNGLELNHERVVYDTSPKTLAEARLNFESYVEAGA